MATYMLIHGGFSGGWIWKRLLPHLRAAGHEVFTPTLTGLGERSHLLGPEIDLDTHIQDVVNVFEYEELRDVVLVGHSSSGMVVAGAADRLPERLKLVVYYDAVVPRDGEAMTDLVDPSFAAMLERSAQTAGDGWRVPPLPLEAIGVTSEADVRWMQPKMGAHPYNTLRRPVQLKSAVRRDVPHAFVYCNQPAMGLFEISARRAREEGWHFQELATPHCAMVTHPQQSAEILMGIPTR
jgi:pimeloyl-ACP methyl ester carboxylesterase